MTRWTPQSARRLTQDASAIAMTEFALVLPVILLLGMTGAEMVNYATTKMRMSQIALQIADNASRMGEGTVAGPKTISETDINDVFTGSQLQSGSLNVQANAKIISVRSRNRYGQFDSQHDKVHDKMAALLW